MAASQMRRPRLVPMKTEWSWWRTGREGTLETAPQAKSIRPTSQSARRDGSETRSTCATLLHSPASFAVERPARLIICGLPNREHWGGKLAMSGPCHFAQLITGHCTVLVMRKNGGGKRALIRLRMRCGFGGIQDMEVSSTRAKLRFSGSHAEPNEHEEPQALVDRR